MRPPQAPGPSLGGRSTSPARAVARALDPLLFARAAAPGRWRRLTGGPGAKSLLWRVRRGASAYVVRAQLSRFADDGREPWALSLAPAGTAPRFVRALAGPRLARLGAPLGAPLGGVLVMEAVDGRSMPRPAGPAVLGAFADAVARLHSVRVRRGPALALPSAPGALVAQATRWAAELAARRLAPARVMRTIDAALRAHTRAIDAAPTSLFARPTLRLCHGDLRPANTRVVAGGVVLLDFEHAGVGDPALDLAMLEARGGLGADELATFVEHYAARSDDPQVTPRLALLAPLVALTAALGAVLDLDDEERGLAAFAPDARRGAERRASVEAELSAALERSRNLRRRASRARRKDDRPWHP